MVLMLTTLFVILVVLTTGLFSCTRPEDPQPNNPGELKASKSTIAAGESVTVEFTFDDPSAGIQPVVARWSVSPPDNVTMQGIYSTKSNTITFSQSGTYTIKTELRRIPCSAQVIGTPDMEDCFNRGATLTTLTQVIIVN